MIDEEQLPLITVLALMVHGYDITAIQGCRIKWCEAGQHLHIDVKLAPKAEEIDVSIVFTPLVEG